MYSSTVIVTVFLEISILHIGSVQASEPHVQGVDGVFRLLESPLSFHGLVGQRTSLRCQFTKLQNISVQWYKDSAPVPASDKYDQIHDSTTDQYSSVLSFHLSHQTAGDYFCNGSTAESWVASKHASVKLSFLNDNFVLEPQDKIVGLGDTVLFQCIPPDGFPKPTVTWLKNNESVILDERMQLSDTGALRIDRVIPQDTGVYICQAESYIFHRLSAGASLIVKQRPYFVESPTSQSVPVYTSFELSCRVAGDPVPTIFWRREPESLSIPVDRARLLSRGTLYFLHSLIEDTGEYVCRALSSTGVIEAAARITIVVPPGLIQTPPSHVSVPEGEKVVLHCSANGSPQPELRWIFDDGKKYYLPGFHDKSGRLSVFPSGSLVIASVRPTDSGQYECRASSSEGVTRTLTVLSVVNNSKLEPASIGYMSPVHLSIPISSRQVPVRLICTAPISPGYMGSYSVLWFFNGTSLSSHTAVANRTHFDQSGGLHLLNLRPNDAGNYTCIVLNQNSRRFAARSIEVLTINSDSYETKTSNISRFPSPPKDVLLVDKGSTWISVKWNDFARDSSTIGYQVYFLSILPRRINSMNLTFRDALLTNGTLVTRDFSAYLDDWIAAELTQNMHFTLTKLLPDTGYWIEVRKVNIYGSSPAERLPHIVYTLPPDSHHKFIEHNMDESYLELSRIAVITYRDFLRQFQSLDFEEMYVRSLTPTELHVSWVLNRTNFMDQIDGFKISSRPVPMTRCFAAIGANAALNSEFLSSSRSPIIDRPMHRFDHCSFSSELSLDHILQSLSMSTLLTSTVQSTVVRMLDLQSYEHDTIMGRLSPTMQVVSGGLHPFTCYEVELGAFKDYPTYGRIWSRSSQPKLALTLDSYPSRAPELVAAEWILDHIELMRNDSFPFKNLEAPSNGVRIMWKPLSLEFSHGTIVAYMVHILANQSGHSLSFKVPPSQHSREIHGLDPNIAYTIYLSGVTCRGEGVRGPGYSLPFAQDFRSNVKRVGEKKQLLSMTPIIPSWIYGIIISVVIFWAVFGLVIPVLIRQHSCIKPLVWTSSGHHCWRVVRNKDCNGLSKAVERKPSKQSLDQRGYDTVQHAISTCCSRSRLELANLSHHSSESPAIAYERSSSSRYDQSTASRYLRTQMCDGSTPLFYTSQHSEELLPSIGMYFHNDPSNVTDFTQSILQSGPNSSHPSQYIQRTETTCIHSSTLHPFADSISGPLIGLSPPTDRVYYAPHCLASDFSPQINPSRLRLDDEIVPPYASCSVLPIAHPGYFASPPNGTLLNTAHCRAQGVLAHRIENYCDAAITSEFKSSVQNPFCPRDHTFLPDHFICEPFGFIPPPPTDPPPPLPSGASVNPADLISSSSSASNRSDNGLQQSPRHFPGHVSGDLTSPHPTKNNSDACDPSSKAINSDDVSHNSDFYSRNSPTSSRIRSETDDRFSSLENISARSSQQALSIESPGRENIRSHSGEHVESSNLCVPINHANAPVGHTMPHTVFPLQSTSLNAHDHPLFNNHASVVYPNSSVIHTPVAKHTNDGIWILPNSHALSNIVDGLTPEVDLRSANR